MKKIIVLFLLMITLAGCSKVVINANMYEIKDYECDKEFNDYYYEILNSHDDYQKNKNYEKIKKYAKEYFLKSSLIIIYIKDSTNANKYDLNEITRNNDVLEVKLKRVSQGLSQVFSIVSYCIEIDSKNINKVELNKIIN